MTLAPGATAHTVLRIANVTRSPQVADDEVITCLERAAAPQAPAPAGTAPAGSTGDPPGQRLRAQPRAARAAIGYFGASTGGAVGGGRARRRHRGRGVSRRPPRSCPPASCGRDRTDPADRRRA